MRIRNICAGLLLSTLFICAGSSPTLAQDNGKSMVNSDVVTMVKAGLSSEIVVAKIKVSATAFDTSAAALAKLKSAGVPDDIILTMVMASAGSPTGQASPAPPNLRRHEFLIR